MDQQQVPGSALHDFEQVYLERLRLAAQVILEAVPGLDLVTDPLEAELVIFKERVEFLLLLPEHAVKVLPWRRLLDGQPPPSRERQAGNGDE
jgi:hypothetical protein